MQVNMMKKIVTRFLLLAMLAHAPCAVAGDGAEKEDFFAAVKDGDFSKVDELLKADGIIFGSPNYYGGMAAPVKGFLDESVKFHGELKGKVGGAFSSSANIGGGNETTIMNILKAFLIHGMIVQGTSQGDHYGPVAIGP